MIQLTRNCPQEMVKALDIHSWPIWSCEVSTFPWHYSEREQCLILEGDVTVTPEGEEPVRFGQGDFVEFPAGMSCTWQVHQSVRKHYRFG